MRKHTFNIFIDLDGTILNVYARYFAIFRKFISSEIDELNTFEDWKKLKRKRLDDKEIFNAISYISDTRYQEYRKYKGKSLEDPNFLALDTLIHNPSILFSNFDSCRFVILTQRNKEKNTLIQLKNLGIYNYFHEIVVVKPDNKTNAKYEYLKNNSSKEDFIIGDSPLEIKAANKLNIKAFHVNTGLYDRDFIEQECIFVENYADAFECIRNLKEKY